MKLGLNMKTSLTQTLTPQQIQYLKLLQLPVVQLEQKIRQEIESNPMLDDARADLEFEYEEENESENNGGVREELSNKPEESKEIDEENDPFEFQKLLWDGVKTPDKASSYSQNDDDDEYDMPYKSHVSESEDLYGQLRILKLSEEQLILGEQILGNIDTDGYLRRDLEEIVDETNERIAELNYELENKINELSEVHQNGDTINPAREYALSTESKDILSKARQNGNSAADVTNNVGSEISEMFADAEGIDTDTDKMYEGLREVDLDDAEFVLYHIRHLDPPGIGSRTIQECLLSQCDTILEPSENEELAIKILEDYYDAFAKKHYSNIVKGLDITEDKLKKAIDVIRGLNPKPGGTDYQNEINTVIPDFAVYKDDESGELIISLNDNQIPELKLNKAYEKMRKEAKYRKYNKDTKDWIRKKYDDAKFLIQAIRQRKKTMLSVMTAIAHLQRDFFDIGENGIKPLIYKIVAEETGLDISTVCRIVNGKYVRTEFGTFELKYFFSESLPTDEGEEVSTRIIKNKLKEIIDNENKQKPFSDQKLSGLLKEKGFNVARRTVAKYREQLKIPVARLRKELV